MNTISSLLGQKISSGRPCPKSFIMPQISGLPIIKKLRKLKLHFGVIPALIFTGVYKNVPVCFLCEKQIHVRGLQWIKTNNEEESCLNYHMHHKYHSPKMFILLFLKMTSPLSISRDIMLQSQVSVPCS